MRESGEDYLETIYLLNKRLNGVHAVDIANELNFSKPSVTRALNILKGNGLIICNEENHIVLTDEGEKKAQAIYERHQVLTDFLISMGVSEENASKDACRVEHVISDETFERIKQFKKNKQ